MSDDIYARTEVNAKITNKPLYLLVTNEKEYYYGTTIELQTNYVKVIGYQIPKNLVKEAGGVKTVAEAEKLGLDLVCFFIGWPQIAKLQVLSYKKASLVK